MLKVILTNSLNLHQFVKYKLTSLKSFNKNQFMKCFFFYKTSDYAQL